MTSKNSFWKYSIWNIKKRSWVLALGSILSFFAFPIFTYLTVSGMVADYLQIPNRTNADYMDLCNSILHTDFYSFLPFIIAVSLGVFMAIQSFAWNNKRQKVDMYKSVPVKESSRFLYIHLNSLLIYAVPFALCLLASNLIVLGYGVYNIVFAKASLMIFLVCVLTFLSVYMLVLIAQLLTGNIALAFFGGVFLLFVEPVCRMSVYAFQNYFLDTFYDRVGTSDFISQNLTSPVLAGLSSFLSFRNSMFVDADRYGFRYYRYGLGFISDNVYYVVLLLLQIVIYTGLAYFLYKKRAAQTGGKAIVFEKATPILKTVIVFTLSLGVGVLMTGAGFYYENEIVYGLIGIILSAILIHLILGAIIEGDFNAAMKKAVKSLPASLLACLLSCFLFLIYAFDIFGFDTYLPDVDELADFSFVRPSDSSLMRSLDSEDEGDGKMHVTDEYAKEVLLTVLGDAMEREQYSFDNHFSYQDGDLYSVKEEFGIDSPLVYTDDNSCETVYVIYRLSNGSVKERMYCLTPTDARKIYAAVCETEGYKKVSNPYNDEYVMNLVNDPNIGKNVVYSSYDFESLTSGEHKKRFSQEETEALAKAMKADLNDRTFADSLKKAPVGNVMIEFFENQNQALSEQSSSSLFYSYMEVYESDERTVALLKEYDLYRDTQIPLDEVDKIYVYCEETVTKENEVDGAMEQANEVIQRVLTIEPEDKLAEIVLADAFPVRACNGALDIDMLFDKDYFVKIVAGNGVEQQYYLYTVGFPEELRTAMQDAPLNQNWENKEYY